MDGCHLYDESELQTVLAQVQASIRFLPCSCYAWGYTGCLVCPAQENGYICQE